MNLEMLDELYKIDKYGKKLLDFLNEKAKEKDMTTLLGCYYWAENVKYLNLTLRETLEVFEMDYEMCKSPIEFLFYCTFCYKRNKNNEQFAGFLQPQVEIGKYIVDFEFVNDYKKIIVECDGHEFHEKTKEQVKKDKQRERDLQKLGYEVVRFSGSEIYNDPEKCVDELLEIMKI